MAELHRGRFAAVLAADTHLQLVAGLAAFFHAPLHQFTNPVLVNALEGIVFQYLMLHIRGEEGSRIVARHPEGGLGTDVAAIKTCIEQVWSAAGVVVLVDLGGAEMNAEMALELLPESQRASVLICNAPVVEGAVMAATEASTGSSLNSVKEAAEEAL